MNYVELKAKLFADMTDFLDNGFKQGIVKAVVDRILPELQTFALDLHQKSSEAREGVWIHEREMIRKDLDQKTGVLGDKIGTLEMYMPQVRVLREAVQKLEDGHERQGIATAKLEECTENLKEVVSTLGGKVNGYAGQINELEDKPGKRALNAEEKRRAAILKGVAAILIALGSALVTLGISWLRVRLMGG